MIKMEMFEINEEIFKHCIFVNMELSNGAYIVTIGFPKAVVSFSESGADLQQTMFKAIEKARSKGYLT